MGTHSKPMTMLFTLSLTHDNSVTGEAASDTTQVRRKPCW